ncbi:MAG: YqgE/AlgH family protein [Acidimicrobiia bacterium]
MGTSLRHHLLIATPPLVDPNFDRSVVLLLEHRPEGAFGVVLNRPDPHRLDQALPGWERLAPEPAVLFVGGPVGDGSGIALTLDDDGRPEVVDLNLDPSEIVLPRPVRVFVGYAAWSPGQLEDELGAGAWVVADARPDDVTTPRPDRLWREVLRRQGGRTAWLANVPSDPAVN